MVEWKSIGSLLERKRVKAKHAKIPVYAVTNNAGFVLSSSLHDFTIHSEDISNYLVVNKNDFAYNPSRLNIGSIAYFDKEGKGAISPMYVVFHADESKVLAPYLYFFIKSESVRNKIESLKEVGARFRFDFNRWDLIEIPLPSLAEQEQIVGILDTFTESIENLKEQIAQRRKQYEHYRDQLLDLEGKPGVEMKTLGEIAKYRRGSFPQPYGNREWYDGEGAMPFVQVADVEEFGRKLKERTKQFISTLAMTKSVYAPIGTVIVTLQGSIGKVAITQYESYIDRTLGIFEGYRIIIDKIYFALQLEKIFSIKKEKARGGIIKTITKEEFTNFLIPVPSLEEQQRIVSILDTFEASISNLEAQLKEREKQYEYYRNKLLTFE